MRHKYSKILVTGGAGFIGSHIVDRLLREGIEVYALDNLYTGRMQNVAQNKENPDFHFVRGDVRNLKLIKKVVKDVDAVFNEAAVVSVPRSVEDPILANEVNVNGALNLLKASLDSDVKRFVQASSASVYGNEKTLPLHEELATQPISPYAVSELAAENYARAFHQTYGVETVCLRYFNVYGPRQTCSPYSGVITIFVDKLVRNEPPIIFGDGEQTRDFVNVEDVTQANMLAMEKKRAVGEVFNVATGVATTINGLVKMLQETMSKTNLKPLHEDSRQGDIRHSYASIEKAKKLLGYEPRVPLNEGLTKLVAWYSALRTSNS